MLSSHFFPKLLELQDPSNNILQWSALTDEIIWYCDSTNSFNQSAHNQNRFQYLSIRLNGLNDATMFGTNVTCNSDCGRELDKD